MNFQSSGRQKYLDSFNFSSLTDVVMQLLIFFLLTFSFANTRGMNVTLPKAIIGQPPTQKTIAVSFSKDKQLFINNQKVSKQQLGIQLAGMLKKEPDLQVVIRADKDILLQDVVEILDITKGAGATRLFIATDAIKGGK